MAPYPRAGLVVTRLVRSRMSTCPCRRHPGHHRSADDLRPRGDVGAAHPRPRHRERAPTQADDALRARRDLGRLGRRGRSGTTRFRHALQLRSTDDQLTESEAEHLIAALLADHGLPAPVPQHEIRDHDGEAGRACRLRLPELEDRDRVRQLRPPRRYATRSSATAPTERRRRTGLAPDRRDCERPPQRRAPSRDGRSPEPAPCVSAPLRRNSSAQTTPVRAQAAAGDGSWRRRAQGWRSALRRRVAICRPTVPRTAR